MKKSDVLSGRTPHGGKREGAGRKVGGNAYGESTKLIRIPLSMVSEIEDMLAMRRAGDRFFVHEET